MTTSACSDEPSPPVLRSASISLFTVSRTARMVAHFASSASSASGRFRNVSVKIESPPSKTFHASSAVKLRNGAIQRSMAWVMRCSAVCALRRARDLGAVV